MDIFSAPSTELHILKSPRPFLQWRLELLDHFLTTLGKLKYLIVDMDYFTKWFEAEELANIIIANVLKIFIWNILDRFGVS